MKKAQLNQVFIYLMVIIVVGAVLLIGYSAWLNIIKQACLVEQETFKSEIRDRIDTYSEYWAVGQVSLQAPCDFETLCFVNSSPDTAELAKYPTMEVEVQERTGNRIFLLKSKQTVPIPTEMPELVVEDGAGLGMVCITKKSGQFSFTLKGIQRGRLSVSAP